MTRRLPIVFAALGLAALGVCLMQGALIPGALAQGAYIRPLSPPPDKPAHGFYIASIDLVPEDLDTDNGLYTANVEVRMQDLPNFAAKNQSMKFTLKDIKATGTIQDVRNQAKKEAEAHFGEIIAAFQKYKDDFDKGRR